jgi:hypothetical protein
MHQLFTISGGASRAMRQSPDANQPAAILAKIRFWRATMRRKAGQRENFFIAKNRDSESARRSFSSVGESR